MGDASLHRDLTGGVLALAGSEDAAEHQLVHLLRLHAGPGQGLLHHHGTQLGGGGVLQASAKGTDGGTAAVDHIDFFHSVTSKMM